MFKAQYGRRKGKHKAQYGRRKGKRLRLSMAREKVGKSTLMVQEQPEICILYSLLLLAL